MPGKRILLLVVMFTVAGVCVRLGLWQLERLEQRRATNELVRSRSSAAVLDLSSGPPGIEAEFRNAVAVGEWDADRTVVVVGRVRGGRLGVYVVTPLVMETGNAILVNRGWMESLDGRTPDLPPIGAGVQAISGFLTIPSDIGANIVEHAWPLRVRNTNIRDLAPMFRYPLLGFVLIASESEGGLESLDRPVLSDGSHLSYAVQWFAFALVAVVGTVALLRKTHATRVDIDTRREHVRHTP